MPADPLGALCEGIILANRPVAEQPQSVRNALEAANSPNGLAPKPAKIWIGGYEGNPPTPFAQIRSRGGPRPANWQPEAMRRIDLFAYGKTYIEADALATAVDEYLRRLYNYDYPETTPTTRIQFVNTESDGIDGIDDDTNLPFMFGRTSSLIAKLRRFSHG